MVAIAGGVVVLIGLGIVVGWLIRGGGNTSPNAVTCESNDGIFNDDYPVRTAARKL